MFNERTGLYEGYIYELFNKFTLKSYVGQTQRTIEERFKKHKTASKNIKKSIYLYSDVINYGWSAFSLRCIEKIECNSLSELKKKLNEREIFHISNLNSLFPNGYNISKGGWKLPNTFDSCKVYKFNLQGELLTSYESMADAAFNNNVSQADISNCCNGKKVATVGGYYWSKSPILIKNSNIKVQKRKVLMFDLNNNFIRSFNSTVEAALTVFGKYSRYRNISKCANGENKTAYGFIWKYDKVII